MSQIRALAKDSRLFMPVMLPERRRRAADVASGPVLLILDARGRIQFCSDAAAVGRPTAEIAGKPVTDFIAGLPLRPNTPGYNIAFVRFAYADEARRRLTLKLPSGDTRPVDVAVRPIMVDRGHCLLVQLDFARTSAMPAAEPVSLPRRQPLAAVETAEVCC